MAGSEVSASERLAEGWRTGCKPVPQGCETVPQVAVRTRARLAAWAELSKLRLSAAVVLTTAVGFVLASGVFVDWFRLGWTLLGTALAACSAAALNQWWEHAHDARMARTRRRPLPTRSISRRGAVLFAVLTAAMGVGLLLIVANLLAALLALLTLVIYVLVYTPLKLRTPVNTLVGSMVGALPPLIGWAAARGELGVGAWLLAGILFVWQVPHFLSLAWLHREDYAACGFHMLPSVDRSGHLTGLLVVVYALLLIPLTLLLTLWGLAGWVYAGGALLLGMGLLAASVAMERYRSQQAAKRLFVASIVYLPLLLLLLLADRATAPAGLLVETTAAKGQDDAGQVARELTLEDVIFDRV